MRLRVPHFSLSVIQRKGVPSRYASANVYSWKLIDGKPGRESNMTQKLEKSGLSAILLDMARFSAHWNFVRRTMPAPA